MGEHLAKKDAQLELGLQGERCCKLRRASCRRKRDQRAVFGGYM